MEEGSSPAVKRLREDEEPTAEPSAVAAPVVDELFLLLRDGKVVSTPRDALLTASNTLRLLSEDVDLTQNALDNALPLPQIDSKIWEVVASLLSAPSMVEAALAKTPLLDVMDLVKALSFLDMPALSAQAISYVARNGERASREVPPNVVASLPDDCRTALVMNVLFERNGPLSGEKDDFGISKLFFGRGMVCIGAGLLSEGVLAILLLDVGKRMTLCRYDASTLNELSRVDLGESPWNWAVVKFACGGGRMCCYGLGGLWVADHASPDVKTKLVLPLSAANAVPVPPIRAEPKIRGEPKISALIVSPDGEWVACCCDDDTVSLFSAATGALTMHLVNPRPVDLVFFWRGGTGSPVFSADSTLLFVRQGGRAKIISVARGEVLHDLGTCQRVFTPPDDARLVVVVAQDGSMRFVDPKTAETTRIVDGQAGLNGDQLTSWDQYFISVTPWMLSFFDARGKLKYSRNVGLHDSGLWSKVLSSGHSLVVTKSGVARVVPPLHEFRVRLRAQETTKLWTYLKQSYGFRSSRLRSQAWTHCLALLTNKSAPLTRRGVERYDPSGK